MQGVHVNSTTYFRVLLYQQPIYLPALCWMGKYLSSLLNYSRFSGLLKKKNTLRALKSLIPTVSKRAITKLTQEVLQQAEWEETKRRCLKVVFQHDHSRSIQVSLLQGIENECSLLINNLRGVLLRLKISSSLYNQHQLFIPTTDPHYKSNSCPIRTKCCSLIKCCSRCPRHLTSVRTAHTHKGRRDWRILEGTSLYQSQICYLITSHQLLHDLIKSLKSRNFRFISVCEHSWSISHFKMINNMVVMQVTYREVLYTAIMKK